MRFRSSDKSFKPALILLIIFGSHQCIAQKDWAFSGNIGLGSYGLGSLRSYQDYLQQGLPVPSQETSKFPMYWTYGAELERRIRRSFTAVSFSHGSTGGRISYGDYSGVVTADQLLKYNCISINTGLKINNSEKWEVLVGLKFSVIFYDLTIHNSVTILGQTNSEVADFASSNLGIQPNIRVKRNFGRFFMLGLAGYEIESDEELWMKGNHNVFLAGPNNNPVSIQGNGIRISCAFGINF